MSKKIAYAFFAVFVLLFVIPSVIYSLIGEYLDKTNYEQRTSAEKPVFSLHSIQDYPRSFEAYYNDHIPFRTQMIEINSIIDFFGFKSSPVSQVIIGKEGWYFYNPAGKNGDPIKDFNGKNLYTPEQLQELSEHLISVRDTLQAQGKEFVVYIAPNKESFYGHQFLPEKYIRGGSYNRAQQIADYLTEHTDLVIVYPMEALQNAREMYPEYTFYYKTDTHWNNLGAYIGARELLKALNVELPELSHVHVTQYDRPAGDLVTMMGLTKFMNRDTEYNIDGYVSNNKTPDVSTQENDNIHEFTTTDMNPKSVLIVRDSFSIAMMPYIASQFNSCSFIHRDVYTPEHLNQYDPDVVVFQVLERYAFALSDFTVQ